MSYFSEKEMACKCCGQVRLAKGFLDHLIELRIAVKHALVVTSMCRCSKHNKAVGGKPNSFHLTSNPWGCCAVDISMANWDGQKRWKFVHIAMSLGWSVGINWSKNFVHLDRRTDYPAAEWSEPVLFPY